MDLEPIMQRLLGDASSYVSAMNQCINIDSKMNSSANTVKTALDQLGIASEMSARELDEFAEAMGRAVAKGDELRTQLRKISSVERGLWKQRMQEELTDRKQLSSELRKISAVEKGLAGQMSVEQLGAAQRAVAADLPSQQRRGLDILKREMRKSYQEYSLYQEQLDSDAQKKQGSRRGFGRWLLAGSIAHLGSQMGPLGQLGGDTLAGGIIAGPTGAALGAAVGVVQIGINAFKTFSDMGHTTLMTVAAGAETAAHKFVTFTEEVVKAGAAMELNRVKFEVLARSPEAGSNLFSGILGKARETPFSTQQLSETTELLLGMGQAVSDILPTMSVFGDLAAGDSDRLVRLARVLEQVVAEGRVTGFRLRALANLGIGSQDIADTMGVSTGKATYLLRQGRVGSDVLVDTFNRLTDSGGRFFDMTARSLQTVSGQWGRLNNVVDQMKGKMGEALLARFDVAGKIRGVVDYLETNADKIQAAFLAVWDRIMAAADVLWKSLKDGVGGVMDAFGLSGKSLEDILPSVQQVRDFMKEMVGYALQFADVLLSATKVFVEMKMVSLSIDVGMLRIASSVLGVATANPAFAIPRGVIDKINPVAGALLGVGASAFEVKKIIDDMISTYDKIAPRIDSGLKQAEYVTRRGLEALSKAVQEGMPKGEGPGMLGAELRTSYINPEVQYDINSRLADMALLPFTQQSSAQRALLAKQIAGLHRMPLLGSPSAGDNITKGILEGDGFNIVKLGPAPDDIIRKDNIFRKKDTLADALDNFYKFDKALEDGITPMERYTRQMKLFQKIVEDATPMLGPLSPLRTPEEGEVAKRGQFEAFLKLQAAYKGPEDRLPPALLAGSAGAQDAINRGMYLQQSAQERIEAVLEQSRQEADNFHKQFEDFKNWLESGGFVKEA